MMGGDDKGQMMEDMDEMDEEKMEEYKNEMKRMCNDDEKFDEYASMKMEHEDKMNAMKARLSGIMKRREEKSMEENEDEEMDYEMMSEREKEGMERRFSEA